MYDNTQPKDGLGGNKIFMSRYITRVIIMIIDIITISLNSTIQPLKNCEDKIKNFIDVRGTTSMSVTMGINTMDIVNHKTLVNKLCVSLSVKQVYQHTHTPRASKSTYTYSSH